MRLYPHFFIPGETPPWDGPESSGYALAMFLNLFEGIPFYYLWPLLALIGVGWYMAICGGLYLLLQRSKFAETAKRWKTQIEPTFMIFNATLK